MERAGLEVKFSYSFLTPEELEELSQSDEVAGGGDYQFLHDSPLSLRRFDQQDPTNPTSIEPSRWCLKVRNVDILCKYVKPRLSGTEGLDVMDGIPSNKVRCAIIARRCAACTTTTIKAHVGAASVISALTKMEEKGPHAGDSASVEIPLFLHSNSNLNLKTARNIHCPATKKTKKWTEKRTVSALESRLLHCQKITLTVTLVPP